jgi:hypothetical protein
MRPVFLILLIASPAMAQYAIDPARGAKFFTTHADDRSLHCEVIPVPARLSFSFRFQTGYVARMPLKQYTGPGHHWNILVRVTPEGSAEPFYLGSYTRLRTVPKTNAQAELGGAYQVGEGRYSVDWILTDDMNRACRKSWKLEAKLDAKERGLKLGMTPNTAGPITFRRWSPQHDEADVHPISRLTVLLHAAPLFPRSMRFRTQDRLLLVSSLAALLEALPARSVRVVVFNLDQQKELFRQDDLTPDSFDQVAQSTNDLQLQLVDYRVLQNRHGHVGLLSDLINQELAAAQPSDKVIFLGPTSRFYDKMPDAALEPHAVSPQFFYFQYKPYWGRDADFPDSVAMAIKKVKGKTILIHTPDEFARAIRDVETQGNRSN